MCTRILLVRPLAGHTSKIMDKMISVLEENFEVDMPEIPHNTYDEYLDALHELMADYDYIIGVCAGGMAVTRALSRGVRTNKKVVIIAAPIKPEAAPSQVSAQINALGVRGMRATYCAGGKALGMRLLMSYMSLSPVAHFKSMMKYMMTGSEKIKSFYDMYFDVEDMSEEFFIDCIYRTFINNNLDTTKIHPSNSILVVEGTKDDITTPGQTVAIFDGSKLPEGNKKALLVSAGHYGCFSGRSFEDGVYPEIKKLFLGV